MTYNNRRLLDNEGKELPRCRSQKSATNHDISFMKTELSSLKEEQSELSQLYDYHEKKDLWSNETRIYENQLHSLTMQIDQLERELRFARFYTDLK